MNTPGLTDPVTRLRLCVACATAKPETEFYLTKKGGTRRQVRCKECDRERRPRVVTGYEPPRPKTTVCRACCSMPWRVEGEKCRECGLEYGEEARVSA